MNGKRHCNINAFKSNKVQCKKTNKQTTKFNLIKVNTKKKLQL